MVNNFLDKKYVVISVMGPHAGESEGEIFKRKIGDAKNIGITFWLMRSRQAKPSLVQRICKEARERNKNVVALFIEASSTGGAMPTSSANSATYYSADRKYWKNLPKGLSPVTGKIDKGAYALTFDLLNLHNGMIDLWNYADFFNQDSPIRIFQGASTLCAIKKDMSAHDNKIKSHNRKIIAIGQLCNPYCVWLK
ncbi:MAG: hypothetical protein P9X22_00435 [Candidatus Zapsychrus exili]|nr:hypothetical protein [Candidatus Zapsychrus exili]